MMTKTKPELKTRRHEHEFEIKASPEMVWKAITDAAELVNWFPFDAEVQPGEGGHITYGWGALRGQCRIEVWQPDSHLRTSWLEHNSPKDEHSAQIAVDWFVKGERGHTRLRLVHSGFGAGVEWDEEFDGTRRGWDFELRSLKHYLENHAGRARTAFWLRKNVALDAHEIWKRVMHPEGLVRLAGSTSLEVGRPVQLSLASGDRIEGTVVQYQPPTDFAWTAENLNRGLMRAGCENCGEGPEGYIWVSLWDYPKDQAASLENRLQEALTRLFA